MVFPESPCAIPKTLEELGERVSLGRCDDQGTYGSIPGTAWVFTDAVERDHQELRPADVLGYAPTTRLEGFLSRFRFITPERLSKRPFTARGLPDTSTRPKSSIWVGYRVLHRRFTLVFGGGAFHPFLELGRCQFIQSQW